MNIRTDMKAARVRIAERVRRTPLLTVDPPRALNVPVCWRYSRLNQPRPLNAATGSRTDDLAASSRWTYALVSVSARIADRFSEQAPELALPSEQACSAEAGVVHPVLGPTANTDHRSVSSAMSTPSIAAKQAGRGHPPHHLTSPATVPGRMCRPGPTAPAGGVVTVTPSAARCSSRETAPPMPTTRSS